MSYDNTLIELGPQDPAGEFPLPDGDMAEELVNLFDEENQQADSLVELAQAASEFGDNVARIEPQDMTPATARVLQVTVEGFQKLSHVPTRVIFAQEDFEGGAQTRAFARDVALEGVGEVVSSAFERLIEWIRKLIAGIGQFLGKIVSGDAEVKKKADINARAAARAMHKQITPGKEEIKNERLAIFFSHKGKVYGGDEIVRVYKEYGDDLKHSFHGNYLREMAARINDVLNDVEKGISAEAVRRRIDVTIEGLMRKSFSDFKKVRTQGDLEIYQKELPFDDRFLALTVQSKDGLKAAFNLSIERTSDDKIKRVMKLPTLSGDQIADLSREVIRQKDRGFSVDADSTQSDLERVQSQIERHLKSMARSHQGAPEDMASVMTFLKSTIASVVMLYQTVRRYDVGVAMQINAYCRESLACYK